MQYPSVRINNIYTIGLIYIHLYSNKDNLKKHEIKKILAERKRDIRNTFRCNSKHNFEESDIIRPCIFH